VAESGRIGLNFHGSGEAANPRLRTRKHRNDQFIFERLDSTSERYFVARPDNRSRDGRHGGRTRDQAKVVTKGIVHNELGYGEVDQRSFFSGAMSCAVPEKMDIPEPVLASQSNVTLFVESSLAVTCTLTRMRSPTRMRLWNESDTFVSVHPGRGIFMLKKPEISDAHHMFGPVGGMPPARSMSSSEFRTELNPEIDAKAIASSNASRVCVWRNERSPPGLSRLWMWGGIL
jgi:hypothetical protein